jgi:integrase
MVRQAFTANGFGGWFRRRCREAGLSAHGLRKAAATRFADNGATAHELMSWFGWSTLTEAERYTRAANRKALAADMVLKLESRTGGGNRS